MAEENESSVEPEFFSQQTRSEKRFYLDMAPADHISLAVVCGGIESCASDYAIHRTTFPYYSIEFVSRGKGSLVLDGHAYDLFPGAVFTYGPGISQDITTDSDEPLEKSFVDFAGSRALPLLQQYSLPPATFARIYATGEVQELFQNLTRDGLKGTRFSGSLCAAMLEYLIIRIADSLMPWEARQTPAFDTYQRCRRHITENFNRLQTLDQIAAECHVDRAYLCRLFRRYDHQTPYRYLTRLKMNLAAERLSEPSVLVKQVAAGLGFEDPFHFSRVFKNTFGLSPEAFRRLR